MAKKAIIWTDTAVKQRRKILRYWTIRNGSNTFSLKLLKIIRENTITIRRHPNAFKKTKFPDTRIFSFGIFSLLYKIKENQIIITAFWDNRQDPDKLLELITGDK